MLTPCPPCCPPPLQLMSDARARQEAEKERGEKQKGMDRLVGNARIKVRLGAEKCGCRAQGVQGLSVPTESCQSKNTCGVLGQ